MEWKINAKTGSAKIEQRYNTHDSEDTSSFLELCPGPMPAPPLGNKTFCPQDISPPVVLPPQIPFSP